MLCAERRRNNGFSRITEIDQAAVGLIAHCAELLDLSLDVARHQLGRQSREGAEVNQRGLDADRQHGLLLHTHAPFRSGDSSWPTLRRRAKFQHHEYDSSSSIEASMSSKQP